MKIYHILLAGSIGLSACEPVAEGGIARGKPFDIEGTRVGDTVRLTLVYRDGAPILPIDEAWAQTRASEVACKDGETAITDTVLVIETETDLGRSTGAVIQVFCTEVLRTEEEIDASGLRV